jgi:hypothetical protein
MVIELDEKGKSYTDFITKDIVFSYVQTITHLIRGFVYVRKGERLIDEINRGEHFIAVTDAEILNSDGKVVQTSNFLVVNREQIVWLTPVEELRDRPE